MDKKRIFIAKNALQKIAKREGKSVEQIRKDIKAAMIVGMFHSDPKVQAYWKRIPCEGDVPTPEEVIIYVASKIEHQKAL